MVGWSRGPPSHGRDVICCLRLCSAGSMDRCKARKGPETGRWTCGRPIKEMRTICVNHAPRTGALLHPMHGTRTCARPRAASICSKPKRLHPRPPGCPGTITMVEPVLPDRQMMHSQCSRNPCHDFQLRNFDQISRYLSFRECIRYLHPCRRCHDLQAILSLLS